MENFPVLFFMMGYRQKKNVSLQSKRDILTRKKVYYDLLRRAYLF